MPTKSIRGVHYHFSDEGSGAPLVLLHGFTGSSQNWAAHSAHFAHSHRVIAPDLLGHGRTDAPPDPARYSMAESAADLAELLAQIAPGPVTLLGYSMGGRLALYFALHYPERVARLILESASPGLATAQERQQRIAADEALAARIERDGIEKFVDFWEGISLFASQQRLPTAEREALRGGRLQNRVTGLAASLRGHGERRAALAVGGSAPAARARRF